MAKGRRKGQLYVHCPVHGPIMIRGQDYQDHLLEHARMHGPEGVPPAPRAEPAPNPAPEPAAPKKRGLLDF